jgi:thymidylate synthase (FAD)
MQIAKPDFEIMYPDKDQARIMLAIVEDAARTCYKSEGKKTADSWQTFIKMLRDRGHEAMIEHSMLTVRFTCDRGISHEWVRHRLASYAQESTRWCDYRGKGISVIIPDDILDDQDSYEIWKTAVLACEDAYQKLRTRGHKPEIARAVLPTCLATEIVVTANWREWRHIFKLRTSITAHPQMRELMIPLLINVKRMIPVVFDDIEVIE